MDFDRKTILAFILIGLILILANTGLYQKLIDPKGYELRQQQKQRAAEQVSQTPVSEDREAFQVLSELEEKPIVENLPDPEPGIETATGIEQSIPKADEKLITVETDLYTATFSSRGASLVQWELKKYNGPDGQNVNLFRPNDHGTLGLGFTTKTGDSLGTGTIVFDTDAAASTILRSNESYTIEFSLSIGDKRSLKKSFTFVNGQYDVAMNVSFENMHDIIADKKFVLAAPNGLASTEKSLKDDMFYAMAGYSSNGKVEHVKKSNDKVEKEVGVIDWAAVRTKYFAFYIIPKTQVGDQVRIKGSEIAVSSDSKVKWKKFSLEMVFPYLGRNVTEEYLLYLGPLEYDVLKKYDGQLHDFMDVGFLNLKIINRPILITLKWLHNFIPNYGIVLLIFSVLIKIIVYPLTHKSYESMQKMQAIQPKLKELQEKYKSDPQKLNQATMAMYKEEGVNPMGGCLPMLIQMPLLIGLFNVFRSTIELRGEPFFWWITDLSAPDTIYTFPGGFSLPLYGDSVNILPLVMGVTMFIQQKMTVTDPKQKMMVYFMPIFLTLLFNSFPSGLNLYYALFNALSILQQKYLTPKKVQPQKEVNVVKRRKK